MNNKNFCYHPWLGIDISPQGEYKPCCKFSNNIADSFHAYKNSPKLKEIQHQFLAGQRPKECVRCWQDESAGLPSKRTIDNQFIFDPSHNLTDSYVSLSVALGNTCNLACVTCSSYASSRWRTEHKKLREFYDFEVFAHKQFYSDPAWLDELQQIGKGLKDITFHGGESFVTGINQQLEFLDFLIKNNAKNITLTYITNTTVFPSEEFWQRWSNFRKVNIQMSIDGLGQRFEYIRWPASWSTCYANIKAYQQKQKETDNLQLSISHTVSIFNVVDLPEFYIWCRRESLPEPYLGLVTTPKYYCVQSLPTHVKQAVSEKLSMKKFKSVVEFMNAENSDNFINAQKIIAAIDQSRSLNFADTFPDLARILDAVS